MNWNKVSIGGLLSLLLRMVSGCKLTLAGSVGAAIYGKYPTVTFIFIYRNDVSSDFSGLAWVLFAFQLVGPAQRPPSSLLVRFILVWTLARAVERCPSCFITWIQ